MKKFFLNPLLREILITAVLALAMFFAARAALQTYEVFQFSMEPNFVEGQRVVVLKAAYWFGDPQRGDVVILHSPISDEEFIKRVIGLPGDTVEIVHGVVYVNGFKLDEPYVKYPFNYSFHKELVSPGNYFVLGDNRDVSNDSHTGWFMPRENLIGKAWLVTWPPSAWGAVPSYPLNDQLVTSANTT